MSEILELSLNDNNNDNLSDLILPRYATLSLPGLKCAVPLKATVPLRTGALGMATSHRLPTAIDDAICSSSAAFRAASASAAFAAATSA